MTKPEATSPRALPSALDRQLGRAVAWFSFVSMFVFFAGLLLVPLLLGSARLPWWVAMVWVALLAASALLCWSPRRWWVPKPWSGRAPRAWAGSSPEWLRIYSLVALFVSLLLIASGLGKQSGIDLGYGWPALGALLVVLLTTLSLRLSGDRIPAPVRASLAKLQSPLLPAERRQRFGARGGNRSRGSA